MRVIVKYIVICLIAFLPFICQASPQKGGVNQKKIDRERVKKQKAAEKQYNQAVKKHKQKQSKETRTMMKQTKKGSKKATPINR